MSTKQPSLFAPKRPARGMASRQAKCDAENLSEAQKVIADPERFPEGSGLHVWANMVVNRLEPEGGGAVQKVNLVNPRTVGFTREQIHNPTKRR